MVVAAHEEKGKTVGAGVTAKGIRAWIRFDGYDSWLDFYWRRKIKVKVVIRCGRFLPIMTYPD